MAARTTALSRTIIFCLLAACGVAVAGPAIGQTRATELPSPTRLLPVSGILTDADGSPRTGPVVVTFGLYDEQADGTLLWTEVQEVQADQRGRYSALLGAVSPLPQAIFSNEQARWLSTELDGRRMPRTMLVAVPYALRAADADTLGGKPLSSFVMTGSDGRLHTTDRALAQPLIDGSGTPGQLAKFTTATDVGSSVISETASGRIGVGLADPTGGTVVDSQFTVRNLDNNTGIAVLNQGSARRFALNTLATGAWLAYDGSGGTWNPGLSQLAGRVGVGTPSPEATLHVATPNTAQSAILKIDGAFNTAGQGAKLRWTEVFDTDFGFEAFLESDANTLAFRALEANAVTADNLLVFTRSAPNNVGIGTAAPADKLHVAGDVRVGTGATGCIRDATGTSIAGTCSSDVRLKKNIAPFDRALDTVARLQPVHFDWRADEFAERHLGTTRTSGLIAQEVEKILPELVTTDEQGYRAVRYGDLPMHMLQAIKDLKSENDELRQRLAQLESRLRGVEARDAR
jgi:hypothetical protein